MCDNDILFKDHSGIQSVFLKSIKEQMPHFANTSPIKQYEKHIFKLRLIFLGPELVTTSVGLEDEDSKKSHVYLSQ